MANALMLLSEDLSATCNLSSFLSPQLLAQQTGVHSGYQATNVLVPAPMLYI